jgi:putative transposase
MFVSIGGRQMYLWRAVDAEDEVLDILVQSTRDKRAATRLMCKLMRKSGICPSALVTDRLPSYGAAFAKLGLSQIHVRGKRKNNRAESSHVPIRRRERKTQGFRSLGSAQRFLSVHATVYNIFNTCCHLVSASTHRQLRAMAFATWREAVGIAA